MSKVVIFGNAEIASLAHFYFKNDSDYQIVAFTVDDEFVREDTLEGLPVIPFSEINNKFSVEEYSMHVALSYQKLNKLREEKYETVKQKGYNLVSYVSSKSAYWNDIQVGDNCFILENQTIQPSVIIKNNVMLWSGNHIGHGTVIGSHTYLASHVVISGHCKIGERCFFGVNATLKDFLEIGDDCFITMDASVSQNLKNGSVVFGAKSEIFEEDHKVSKIVKKKYFGL